MSELLREDGMNELFREDAVFALPPSTTRRNVPAPNRIKMKGGGQLRMPREPTEAAPPCEIDVPDRSSPKSSWKSGGSLKSQQVSDRRSTTASSISSNRDDDNWFEIDRGGLIIGKQIGAGFSATVFAAEWNGKPVAVKEIKHKGKRISHKDQISLAREVGILTQLGHPNLVTFYGTCFLRRPFILVFELCEGGALFEVLHNQIDLELFWRPRIKMLSDVAAALAYLHEQNPPVVHRDLKSLNLLLTRAMRSPSDIPHVKVTDFGLARTIDIDDTIMTRNVGSIYWMAPEVFQGSSYDEKVDVYSFAMVTYEVVCREIPFDEFQPSEIASVIARGDRPRLNFVPPECPGSLSSLMVSCWAPNPSARPTFESIFVTLRTYDLDAVDGVPLLGIREINSFSESQRFQSLSSR